MDEIEREDRGGVRRLRLNRPDKRNALTRSMYAALAAALEGAEADGVRAIWLCGAPGCFTAGNDIEDFRARGAAGAEAGPSEAIRFLRAISTCPVPVLASVAGHAVGIGTTLLLHCDLVYLAADARLQLPFVNLGLCPEAASTLLLPRLAGMARAADLLMFGEPFGAEAALSAGLATEVLPDGDAADRRAGERAAALAAKPADALRTTKRLLRRWLAAPVAEAIAAEAADLARLLPGPEAREAFEAFLEKRAPDVRRIG